MWTATFNDDGKGVGTLEAVYNAGQQDEFRFSFSIDMEREKDLAPLAEKVKAIYAEHLQEVVKPSPYADAVAAFESALNGGK